MVIILYSIWEGREEDDSITASEMVRTEAEKWARTRHIQGKSVR